MNKSILAGAALLAAAARRGADDRLVGRHRRRKPAGSAGAARRRCGPDMGRACTAGARMGAMRSPQQRCEERHRPPRRASSPISASLLNLTAEQKPLCGQGRGGDAGGGDKEHQLCARLPSTDAKRGQATVLDRHEPARADAAGAARTACSRSQPALQALYQSLTPEQKAIVDHPFQRG